MKDNKSKQKYEKREDVAEQNAAREPQAEETGNVEIQDAAESDGEENETENLEAEVLRLNQELEKEKKEYLFLMAEFDNFRKRTLREKSELIKNAGEQVLKGLLPILDDFERGLEASRNAEGCGSVLEGMELIYHKLQKYLEQNGVKEIDPDDLDFDTEKHEAISAVPVGDDEEKKGKIIDTVQKGYTLNGKVLRHAKVVVGQ